MLYSLSLMENSHLLVINYSMNIDDPLLSHQYDTVICLAQKFRKVTVITGSPQLTECPQNVTVYTTNWRKGEDFKNVFKFLWRAIPILLIGNVNSVFSHMTERHSALISPITSVLRIRHVLWYAHAHLSIYLWLASKFVDVVVTSTSGSCPLKTRKVICIGQAISPLKFEFFESRDYSKLDSMVHIGRLDKSKQIDLLLQVIMDLRDEFPILNLDLIGDASRDSDEWIKKFKSPDFSSWLKFKGSIPRQEVAKLLNSYDVFLHAYMGSIDKVLIEATLSGVPVVTSNPEYLNIFGSWEKPKFSSHMEEYRHLRRLSTEKLKSEVLRRKEIAVRDHSLEAWIDKLCSILVGVDRNSECSE